MKTVIEFLDKRIKLSDKAGRIVGWVFTILFAVSLALFGYLSLKMDILICAVLFIIICVPFLVFKYYRLIFNNTVILHIVCLAAGTFFAFLNNRAAVGEILQFRIWAFIFSDFAFFCFLESISGFIMNFSGGKTHSEYFKEALFCTFPLFLTAFFYIPSETFFNNRQEFQYSYLDFGPYIFIKTALFIFILSVIMCSFSRKGFETIAKLAVGLALCCYCQYMFMNGDLSPEIGTLTDWSTLTVQMIINAVIWLILLVLPFVISFAVKKIPALKNNRYALSIHSIVTAFIGVVQFVSLIAAAAISPEIITDYSAAKLNSEEQFTVSGKRNIVTLIIDAGDQAYFEEAYRTQPEKFECLKDFTIYTNTCMMYDSTYHSIPEMLTGARDYPEGDGIEWRRTVWESERCRTFYSRLHQNNYKVNFYGDFLYDCTPASESADNINEVKRDEIILDSIQLFQNVDSFAAYRYLPIFAKKGFEPDIATINDAVYIPYQCLHRNEEFLEHLDLEKADNDYDYFIVEHVLGTHRFNSDLNKAINDSLEIMNRYISQLKELGLYDDAAIIITADHGEHDKPGNTPIFFMKAPGETHDSFVYNNAPIYHTDYLATCLKLTGLWQEGDEELFGRAVMDIPEDEQRTRLVFARYWYGHDNPDYAKDAFGYYYTGDRYELERREKYDDPDIILHLKTF